MNNQELNKHIQETKEKMIAGLEESVIEKSLRENAINLFTAEKIIRNSKKEIENECIIKGVLLIEEGSSKEDIIGIIPNRLSEELTNDIIKKIDITYKRKVKNRVINEAMTSGNYKAIIEKFKNEFITKEEVKNWILYHFRDIRRNQKKNKNTQIMTGVALLIIGLAIPITTYIMSMNGGYVVVTYGLIGTGFVGMISGFAVKVIEIPELND